MEVGDALTVFGPLGNGYDLDAQDGGRPILVAGGVGVAPLLYLAREFHAAGTRSVFIYGGRTEDDLPLAEDIAEVADLVVTTENGARGEQGRVTAPWPGCWKKTTTPWSTAVDPTACCTRYPMSPRRPGVPCQLALEAPMACGMGTCKGCAVMGTDGTYKYVCYDGPVFEAADIFEAAS